MPDPITEAATPAAAAPVSPVSTSPESVSQESPPSSSTPDTSTEVFESEDSAPPDFGLQPLRSGAKSTGKNPTSKSSGFDVGSWDGDISKLPADVRDFVDVLSRKKFSAIESEFKQKEAELTRAQKAQAQAAPGADARVADLERELELYKMLAEGAEDPRVNDLSTKLADVERRYNDVNARYEAQQKEADERWFTDFKTRHSTIFSDKAKSEKLLGYVDQGWDEEAAAELVGLPDNLVQEAANLVRQHKIGLDGHVLAIQHVKMKSGASAPPRQARPAADLTSGANGQRNSSRVPGGSLRELPRHEARAEAARLALVDSKRRA